MSVLKTYGEDTESFKPSKTYALNGTRIEGMVDGLDAIKQAVYFALSAERYEYEIYSWDYGVESSDLIGKPRSYVEVDLERRITECLLEDDRITSIENFEIAFDGENANVSFDVVTDFGNIEIERSVAIG